MAEEHHHKSDEYDSSSTIKADEGAADQTKDRGLFDFLGKKEEEKPVVKEEEVIVTEFEKVHVSESEPKIDEDPQEEKKHGLFEKLHRSDSSSSSSSDEEEVEGEKKKKKKKEKKEEDTSVPVEKCDEVVGVPPESAHEPEEKKGFLEKIKEKLPGQTKKTEDAPPPAEYSTSTPETHTHTPPEAEPKEKKGILEKIKEKLPGYHPKTEEDKEKESH